MTDENDTAGEPGQPGKPSHGSTGGTGGAGGAGGRGEVTGGPGGTGGIGGIGSRSGERDDPPDGRNAKRSYWFQVGVIPRWQLFAVYLLIVAAGIVGFARTQHVAHRADQFARAIQDQRISATRAACTEQNERHDNTLSTLDRLIAKIPPGARHDRAMANRRGTVLLIDALAPKRDCERLVRRVTGGK